MNRLGAIWIAAALTAPLSAAPTDLSVRLVNPKSIGFKHAVYDTATGELEPAGIRRGSTRIGEKFWACLETTGYFAGAGNCLLGDYADELLMDWMDIPAGSQVGGIRVAYATDASPDPNAVRMTILFQNNAAGYGDNTGPFVAGFRLDLPGRPPNFPYPFVGWIITIDLEAGGLSFTYGDADIDGDGLADTGYYYGFLGPKGYGDGTAGGPLICEPNDPLLATGAENAVDFYTRDPNHPCEDPNAPFVYDWSYESQIFFMQWALALYHPAPGCPSTGCENGDLDGDCVVGLADLSDLLENFGCALADACYDADADIDGDGMIGLSDLSALLGEFGADCTQAGPPSGACCFADGNCSTIPRYLCDQFPNAVFQGAGTSCDTDPCATPGACCFDDGSCTELSRSECEFALGGSWLGAGTPCTPNPCPQPGACCLADGSCQVVSQHECDIVLGGEYRGNGTACEPNPCPPPGACCFPDGTCTQLGQWVCEVVRGGVFQGEGTTCDPNPCPSP
ncbi:MAG: hypothetical protein HRF50_09570 [Phycisphaerae bacterium]